MPCSARATVWFSAKGDLSSILSPPETSLVAPAAATMAASPMHNLATIIKRYDDFFSFCFASPGLPAARLPNS